MSTLASQHSFLTPWWGEFKVPRGRARCFRVGPLRLHIQHLDDEWRVTHSNTHDPVDTTVEVDAPCTEADLPEETPLRFATRSTSDCLHLTPILPDRPVVVRPDRPLSILPGESCVVYLSVPVWVRIAIDDPPKHLTEVAAYRLSDTWFGQSTITGELGYATQTSARLDLETLPRRPHRVFSAVRIVNRAADTLPVERINLPTLNLGVHSGGGDILWTESLTLTREPDGQLAAVTLGAGPPAEAGSCTLLSTARQPSAKRSLLRGLAMLVG